MTSHARDDPASVATPTTDLSEHCRLVVRHVLARYDWALAPYEPLVQEVLICLEAGEAAEPWPATINVYCRHLYSACTGSEGPARQERGFIELHRYLYEISFREVQ